MSKDSLFWKMLDGRAPPAPSSLLLGSKLVSVDGERGIVEATFQAIEDFLNPIGVVQGGFLTAMLDATMGPAVVSTVGEDEFAPTVDLNVQFHRPAQLGELKAIGRVTMRGREICYVSGELFQNDKIVATATATAVIRKVGRRT